MLRIIPYIVTLVVFFGLDAVWLTLTGPMYQAKLHALLATQVKWAPGALFYLVQVLGIQIFVLPRARNVTTALGFGAGFGIFTYATYDLTNWAVLEGWPLSITVMDICWGAVVTAIASLAGFKTAGFFKH